MEEVYKTEEGEWGPQIDILVQVFKVYSVHGAYVLCVINVFMSQIFSMVIHVDFKKCFNWTKLYIIVEKCKVSF